MASCGNVIVYLVGAGPGDPGLLTVAGRDALACADAVIYDYLSDGCLLDLAPAAARRIDVGKKGFAPHITQDGINGIIIEQARELAQRGGGTIVRLKGGDPFVFGRGGEEALALRAAGVPFAVIPGVTSGIAAPAYAGIPVTHRGVSTSVTFVTGNEDPSKPESAIDWTSLVGLGKAGGTLCFYMGVRNLPSIAEKLLAGGLPGTTPAALVQWGTKPSQRTLVSTLEYVAADCEAQGFAAPCIIVVGEVAALREEIRWFEDRPLFGTGVVVTRSRTQASGFSARLAKLGARVCELPTIQIDSLASGEPMRKATLDLREYDWAVFTSVNGVDCFFDALHAAGLDSRAFGGVKVAAIGPATAARLAERGIRADVVPSEYRAEAVFEALLEAGMSAGRSVLLARAQQARDVLVESLRAVGATVEVVAAYRTVIPQGASTRRAREILADPANTAVTFTSSSTASNLAALLGGDLASALAGKQVFSIGPITTQTLVDLGVSDIMQAGEYTIDGLVDCMLAASPTRKDSRS